MKPIYMLDTNVPIAVMRGREPAVAERFSALNVGDACISVIVYGELMHGLRKSLRAEKNEKLLAAVLEEIEVLPLTIEAAKVFGALRAYLERAGGVIGQNDLWIAAHAISEDITLITGNVGEFRRIPGLKVENWSAALK